MKKIITLTLAVGMAVLSCLTFGACKKDDNTICLNEVTHSIFYAPLYIAMNMNYFEDAGLKIELVDGKGSDKTMAALTSNSADIGLMGPETVVYVIANESADHPVIFGQLTKRDGSFIVGRNAEPDFKMSDLAGKHILAGRKGGMPQMSLQYAVNLGGLEITDMNFDMSVEFANMAPAFDGDSKYDYCTMFEPTASDFVRRGRGHIVAAVGEQSGEIPFTAFAAKKSYLDKNPEKVEKFLECIVRAYKYIVTEKSDVVAQALMPSFPATTKEDCVAVIESYVRIDAWMDTPVMKEDAFKRMQDVMINAGELTEAKRVPFAKAVDNSFAQKVMEKAA